MSPNDSGSSISTKRNVPVPAMADDKFTLSFATMAPPVFHTRIGKLFSIFNEPNETAAADPSSTRFVSDTLPSATTSPAQFAPSANTSAAGAPPAVSATKALPVAVFAPFVTVTVIE